MMNVKKPLTESWEWFTEKVNEKQRRGIIAVSALIAIMGLSQVYFSPSSHSGISDYEPELSEAYEDVFTEDEEPTLSNSFYEATILRGESLYSILTGEGLTPAEVHEIASQLKKSFSIRNFRPGKSYLVEKDPEGNFLCFTYQQSPSSILHVEKEAESAKFNIWQETFEYQNRVAALSGTVSSTISAELLKSNRYALISQLQKLFTHKVNFRRDIQPGTTYNILFEEQWIGDEFVGIGNILAAEIYTGKAPATAYRYIDSKGNTGYYDSKGKSLKSSKALFVKPCRYSRVSSRFGYRTHPILRRRHFHGGVDFAAPRGTPVYAAADGKIIFRGRKGAAGNMVTLSHANGYQTKYLHLSRFNVNARSGSRVRQGQVIGYVGSTGRSTGPHLDFRIVHRGKLKNPLEALKSTRETKGVPKSEMDNFLAQISVFRTQLENSNILVAGLAKSSPDNATVLN